MSAFKIIMAYFKYVLLIFIVGIIVITPNKYITNMFVSLFIYVLMSIINDLYYRYYVKHLDDCQSCYISVSLELLFGDKKILKRIMKKDYDFIHMLLGDMDKKAMLSTLDKYVSYKKLLKCKKRKDIFDFMDDFYRNIDVKYELLPDSNPDGYTGIIFQNEKNGHYTCVVKAFGNKWYIDDLMGKTKITDDNIRELIEKHKKHYYIRIF